MILIVLGIIKLIVIVLAGHSFWLEGSSSAVLCVVIGYVSFVDVGIVRVRGECEQRGVCGVWSGIVLGVFQYWDGTRGVAYSFGSV